MRLASSCSILVLVLAHCGSLVAKGPEPLVVHEWGTFTVLQDDHGNPVDGVNINEESLPGFVHKLAPHLAPDSHALAPLLGVGQFQARRSKGIARSYYAARMRMETPIIYFYPPMGQPKRSLDVSVQFNGGWVTEWYPEANVKSPGYRVDRPGQMDLRPTTVGELSWKGVQFAADAQPPSTHSPVWLAPRAVSAPKLSIANGEAEHYLFYRGVANLEAPLRVKRDGKTLEIWRNAKSTCPNEDLSDVKLWLVDVQASGKLKYRSLSLDPAVLRCKGLAANVPIATTAATLDKSAHVGLASLRSDMIRELVVGGLFEDEAEAMLNTWEASYFKTPGMRVFFTLPQEWTDRVLPLTVKGYERTEFVRTMIGRIEMISTRQRELIEKIAAGPVSNRAWYIEWAGKNPERVKSAAEKLFEGRTTIEELGLDPPADYRAYIKLGRFRDALIHHAQSDPKMRENLRLFANSYGLN